MSRRLILMSSVKVLNVGDILKNKVDGVTEEQKAHLLLHILEDMLTDFGHKDEDKEALDEATKFDAEPDWSEMQQWTWNLTMDAGLAEVEERTGKEFDDLYDVEARDEKVDDAFLWAATFAIKKYYEKRGAIFD
jgi:hypothetical protein